MMNKPKAVIIGSGIGGIAAAARLAKNGFQVTVFEKNAQPGGRCGHLSREGHYFDTGPTLFLMPEFYAQTFTELEECMEDHLDLRRVDPTYSLFFTDGSTISLTSDLNTMKTQLESIEPGGFGAYLQYLSEGERHYNLSMTHIGRRDFRKLSEFANLRNLTLLLKVRGLTKHFDNIGRYFADSRLKEAFTFQNMYMGLSPFQAPATFSLLQYSELADGVWYPAGGMYRVIEALMTIAQKWGVEFVFNAPVARIKIEGEHATGICLADGQQLEADVVVANADLPYVYSDLLPADKYAKKLARKEYSCSAITFFWGINGKYPQLSAHNIFFANDYHQYFKDIHQTDSVSDDPMIYLHAPARIDGSCAPEGQDTLISVIPVCHLNNHASQDWARAKQKARRCIFRRLAGIGIENIEDKIKFEMSYTPPVWKNLYNLVKGATHGLDHNLTQMAYFRPHNQHARYRNVYFVGASTHPGTGLPAVLVSAKHAVERIFHDIKNPVEVPKNFTHHLTYEKKHEYFKEDSI